MKVFNNIGSNNNIQNAYSELVKVCLSKRAPIKKVKTEYWLTNDLFVKNGQVQDFYDKTLELSQNVEAKGNKNIREYKTERIRKGTEYDS